VLNANLLQHTKAVDCQVALPAVLQVRTGTLPETHPARLQRMPQRVLLWGHYRVDIVQGRECENDFFGGFDGVICESALVKGCKMRSARVNAHWYYRSFEVTHIRRDEPSIVRRTPRTAGAARPPSSGLEC